MVEMKDKDLSIHGGKEGTIQGYLVERQDKKLRLPGRKEG